DVEDPSGLAAGTYNVTVTDANGCTKTANITITEPTNLIVTATQSNILCNGDKTGTINLSVTGGTPGYSFDWDNAPDVQNPTGLKAGSYMVVVSDKNDCYVKLTVQLTEPNPIVITSSVIKPTCFNGKNGQIQTNVTGGTAPYVFDWDNAQDIQNPSNLGIGTYNLTVTDKNGCTSKHTVTISGYQNSCINIGDYIWIDGNKNGLQDGSEKGVNGIKVNLIDIGPDMLVGTSDDKIVATQTTKTKGLEQGYYLFENVDAGKYVIMFMPDLTVYKFTKTNQGSNDLIDSDANTSTGKTDIFTIVNGDKDNLSFDAGLCLVCENLTNGGTIGYDETLCSPGSISSDIVNITLPSGGSGTIEYVWMYSTKDPQFSANNPDWYPIANSNSPSYSPGKLFETTYFVRCARREGCTIYSGESNEVTKTVLQNPIIAQITEKPLAPICKKQVANFSALENNIPGIQYYWYFGPDANPTAAVGKDASTFWTSSGSKVVTLTVSVNGFCTTNAVAVVTVGNCISNKIKIVSFEAKTSDGVTADLTWKTNPLPDQHSFKIEKSNDGLIFNEILKTAGFKDYSGQYNEKDNTKNSGIVYYRIKLETSKGEVEFSEIKLINFDLIPVQEFNIYPNPTTGQLYLDAKLPLEENCDIIITDLLGRILIRQSFNKDTENSNIDVSEFTNGVYLVQIRNKNNTTIFNKTILKQ
ncbi:MAG: T9SS type A sorting domain-containing protein, partial [Saprospiraceae bacterium]|nr:T9SS type A sorting domain-containing protein [Saprospiraceae bacterium]